MAGSGRPLRSTAVELCSTADARLALLYVERVLVAARDVPGLKAGLSPDEQRHLLSDLHFLDRVRHVFGLVDGLMVQLDDDVARLEADLIRRASGDDVADDDAVLAVITEVVADLRRQRPELHADERM